MGDLSTARHGSPDDERAEPVEAGDAGEAGEIDDARYEASLSRLRDGLAGIVEAMDDLVLEILRDAADAGATGRPALERRVTRARNGVERALHLLGDGEAALD